MKYFWKGTPDFTVPPAESSPFDGHLHLVPTPPRFPRTARSLRRALAALSLIAGGTLLALPWLLPLALSHQLLWTVAVILTLLVAFACLRHGIRRRAWIADHERLPHVTFQDGGTFPDGAVVIDEFRTREFLGGDRSRPSFTERTIHLADIRCAELAIELFSAWRALAHTLVSFGLANGEWICVSVEARRRRGQPYELVRGLIGAYPLVTMIGSERDFLGVRAAVRQHPVYLYPLALDAAQSRTLFTRLCERANELAQHPERYNTLTNNCTTDLIGHLEELAGRPVHFDLRALMPGYIDRVAHDLDLLAIEGRLEQVRPTYRIPTLSPAHLTPAEWSHQIRTGRTSPPDGT